MGVEAVVIVRLNGFNNLGTLRPEAERASLKPEARSADVTYGTLALVCFPACVGPVNHGFGHISNESSLAVQPLLV